VIAVLLVDKSPLAKHLNAPDDQQHS